MKSYYRISDNSYNKAKLPGANKQFCLVNFLKSFKDVTIIADNCSPNTINMCQQLTKDVKETNFGNAGALRAAFKLALASDNQIIYFVEDDYIHLNKKLNKLILEGLEKADYVTLYDHPDKYLSEYGFGEDTKVFKTESSHWKYTISTTMTFATTKKVLEEDHDIWLKHIDGVHPNDHYVFCELKEKGRTLACPIPGYACHVDLTYSEGKGKMYMEPWAIKILEKELSKNLDQDLIKMIKREKKSLSKLMMLHAAQDFIS